MEQDRPSLTASRVATIRAVHQILDNPKVLDDPIALKIIGSWIASEIRATPEKFETTVLRYLRAFLVARSRYTEDALSEAFKSGVRQYVILGAGLDTFAYRNSLSLRIFEVDHPNTQAWKRTKLDNAGIKIPQSMSFVPINFESQILAEQLQQAGFRIEEPSFFSWLGVTMYLSTDAIMTTMKYIAKAPVGSEIVFDYSIPPASLSPANQSVFKQLADRVAAVEEPWQTFFDPHSLASELKVIGFAHAEDIGPEELNMRFFNNRTDGLKVGNLAHLMKARL